MNLNNRNTIKDRIDRIKLSIDPVYLAERLGFTSTRDTSKEFRSACIIHGGDNPTAFRLNKELKTWVCFTHKCHEAYGNDLIGLVRSINNISFMDALEYLEMISGTNNITNEDLIRYRHEREKKEFVKRFGTMTPEVPDIVDPIKLKYYKPYRSSLFLEDGFREETLDNFEVAGGYVDSEKIVRDIIPIYDVKNRLVAYSLRDIRRGIDDNGKYKLTTPFDKDSVLYNLNNAKEYCHDLPLIVVEGFKSVWKLYELGIFNVVACMGSGITEGQAELIFSYAEKGVVLFFDNDLAGMEAIGRSYELLKGKINIYTEIITEVDEHGNGLDPAELTDEQIFYYLENYIDIGGKELCLEKTL
jgi:DNA primase